MSIIGSVGVRVIPDLSGMGGTVAAAVTGAGSVFTNAGIAMAALVTAPIVGAMAASLGAAANWETAFAEVRKAVEAPEEVMRGLEEAALNMARNMPFAREEIALTMAAAGRFTDQVMEIPRLTEVALMLGVTTGQQAAAITEQLIRLMGITETPLSEAANLGSALTELGNNLPTTETNILSMAQRLAQIGATTDTSTQDILGMAAGLSSLGIRAEMGGSAMSRVFYKIQGLMAEGGDAVEGFATTFGLSAEEFSAAWERRPTEAVTMFLEGVRNLNEEGANVPGMLKEWGLGEIRVRDTIMRTAAGLDTFNKAMWMSNEAYSENTAMQEEYNKKAGTFHSQWKIFKNRISDSAVVLGKALLPVMLQFMDALEPVVNWISQAAHWFSALDPKVQQVAIKFALVVAAIGPIMVIGSKIFGLFGALAALFSGPVLLAMLGIALMSPLIVKHWDTIKPFFMNLWSNIKQGAADLLAWFKTNWPAIKAVLMQVWEAYVAFFNTYVVPTFQQLVQWGTQAVQWFIANWPQIRAVMESVWNWLVNEAWPMVQQVFWQLVAAGESVVTWAQERWVVLRPIMEQFFNWLRDEAWPIVQEVAQFIITEFQNLVNWTQENWPAIWETIKNVMDAITFHIDLAMNVIKTTFEVIWGAIKLIWEQFGDEILEFARITWETIKGVVQAAIEIVRGIINTVTGVITGDWEQAWNGIKTIFSGVWSGIVALVTGFLETMKLILSTAWDLIKMGVFNAWEGIKEVFRLAWEAVKTVFELAVQGIVTFMGNLGGWIIGAIGDLGGLLLGVGKDIIQGLIDGINSMIGPLKSALNFITDLIPDWKGPATRDRVLLVESGNLIMEGFMRGMQEKEAEIRRYLQSFTASIPGTTSTTYGGALSAAAASPWGSGPVSLEVPEITLIIEGHPVRAMIAESNQEIVGMLKANRR